MGKRREKRLGRQPSTSHDTTTATDGNQSGPGKNGGSSINQELERQIGYVKAISAMEIEQLLTSLKLLRLQITEKQRQTPVLQFFEENLPNVSVVRNGDEHFDLRWKDENGNLIMHNTSQKDIHASLLHCMRMAGPSCSNARESFGGYQFSGKGAYDFQIENYMSQESRNSLMLGLPEGLQTPGVSTQRLSIGVTPKTRRLPKPGEMLLSVHGSPLGFCKEDNMEAINESEEG